VNNPKYQPKDESYIGYDFSGMSFSSNPVTIEYKKDSMKHAEYSAYEGEWKLGAGTDSILSGKTEDGYFVAKNGVVDFTVSNMQKEEGMYRTIVYINNKPVKINSKDYLEYTVKSNENKVCNISVDISKYNRINTVYAVTTLVENTKGEKALEISNKTGNIMVVNDLQKAVYADKGKDIQDVLSNIAKGGIELKEKRLPNINYEVETKYLGNGVCLYMGKDGIIYKYNINKSSILAQSEAHKITDYNVKLYCMDSGYALKYESFENDAVTIVFYNDALQEIKTVDVSSLIKRDEFSMNDPVALSSDGRYLSYVDYCRKKSYGALFVYDLEKNEKKQISKLYNEYPESNKGTVFIYSLQFSADNKLLYFAGSKYLTEDKQVDGIGAIGIDGKNMKFYEANVEQEFQVSDQYAIFYEGYISGNKEGSGVLAMLDGKGNLTGLELSSKNESKRAFVSEKGNIIVTVEEMKRVNNPPYVLRAYDVKTGKVLMEQQAKLEGYDYSNIRQIEIMEDNKSIIVYYFVGTENGTKEGKAEDKAMIYKYD
jgi:hypothetical protein